MHSRCMPEMTEVSAPVMMCPSISPWPLSVFRWPWAQMERVLGLVSLSLVPLNLEFNFAGLRCFVNKMGIIMPTPGNAAHQPT